MINLNIKVLIGLTIGFLVGGIILAFTVSFWYALPLLIVGLILLAVYILFGSVNSAAKHIQNGEFDEAEKKLKLTLKPDWLYVTQRAFFYIMQGSIAMNKKDTQTAELLFDKALGMNLPSDNERGMILLQLANINGAKGKWPAAKNYMREAKKLKITESAIKQQLNELDKMLNQSGQVQPGRVGAQMMQMGSKSKRRRPKMR